MFVIYYRNRGQNTALAYVDGECIAKDIIRSAKPRVLWYMACDDFTCLYC